MVKVLKEGRRGHLIARETLTDWCCRALVDDLGEGCGVADVLSELYDLVS